jgi:hypothetical protein
MIVARIPTQRSFIERGEEVGWYHDVRSDAPCQLTETPGRSIALSGEYSRPAGSLRDRPHGAVPTYARLEDNSHWRRNSPATGPASRGITMAISWREEWLPHHLLVYE